MITKWCLAEVGLNKASFRLGELKVEALNRRRVCGPINGSVRGAEVKRGGVARTSARPSFSLSPRRPLAHSSLRSSAPFHLRSAALFAGFILCLLISSCGPKRNAPVAENATFGYCPVCGMQVNAGDPWAAEIRFNDGTKLMFESPGDMAAFYASPKHYQVNDWLKEKANIKTVMLKDYNTREAIDGENAELVVKSRVDGPMGPDFFPFSTRQAAEVFAAANGGTLIKLADVTVELVRELGRN